MRALIYARYSTDKQRESSLDDQYRICRARCEAQDWEVVNELGDEGISGSTPVSSRNAGARLLADALAERFDVLVVEGLDRLSRDQVEQERIVRRLEHRGLRIVGVADGYDSQMSGRKIMRGVRGLINEMYLDDLRHKTQRGLHGQFERGYIVGGKSYGYDIVRDGSGSRYVINEEQAAHVRWIFEKYAEGWGVQRIAFRLNELKVPSPRGTSWAVSALFGSPAKGSGILNNELYAGRYVWNRSQWVKDPDTGSRKRIERPQSEWLQADVPTLRIVDADVWTAARQRIDTPRAAGGQGAGQAPRTLFGGLLRCGVCGGLVVAISRNYYGCMQRKDRGKTVCTGTNISREKLETRLLSLIRDELFSQASLSELEQLVRAAIDRQGRGDTSAMENTLARRKELQGEIDRLVDAIAKIGLSDALQTRLADAETELNKLATIAPVKRRPASVTAEELMNRIQQRIMAIHEILRQGDTAEARTVLAGLFGPITIVKREHAICAEFDTPIGQIAAAAIAGDSLNYVAGPRNH